MSEIKKVIVIGATGEIGRSIIAALLSHGFTVTILTRSASSTSVFPPATLAQLKIIAAEYTPETFRSAFTGQDAIVSAISIGGISAQIQMIDAAADVGVQRFMLSEFGNAPEDVQGRLDVPSLKAAREMKVKVLNHAKMRVDESKGKFEWSAVAVGSIIDWAIIKFPGAMGFDIPNRTARLYDDGTEPFTGTRIADIGLAVAGSLANPSKTANRFLRLRSVQTTQLELLHAFNDATQVKWANEFVSSNDVLKNSEEAMRLGEAGKAVQGFVAVQTFQKGAHRSVVATKEEADNGIVGLEEVDAVEIVRGVLKALGESEI
ncbi:NAD(P)-binding protein [Eremomyces bilateralis CBS 781.70]|uniref:NAD(P)-binding protein n=1 Tax=Eremomyces bilateralis CBS 781.70 TaxID=1392243 RepID=A0A6G1GHJ3_9PEZI|nr:NAD(P)-binding protein [Eremomyces bilateralis CBS 781.70]KAF1817416.1 NAD(P)-binding protein [Eremomyces bilateralis CBS 781.70]